MALTNAEKQARWRERHAMKRYAVQRISKAILRRQWNDDTIAELASALRQVLTTSSIAALRRALKPETMKEGLARQKEALRRELASATVATTRPTRATHSWPIWAIGLF